MCDTARFKHVMYLHLSMQQITEIDTTVEYSKATLDYIKD